MIAMNQNQTEDDLNSMVDLFQRYQNVVKLIW